LIALDAGPDGATRSYLVSLAPLHGEPGIASGTISLYSTIHRWDVPLKDAVAAGSLGSPDPTVLVVRFPEPQRLDAGRLTSLAGPNGGTCRPVSAPVVSNAPSPDIFAQHLLLLAKSVTPVDAPVPADDPAPDCARPNLPAAMTNPVQPRYSDITIEQDVAGRALVRVTLADDGEVVDAVIYRSSGFRAIDEPAFKAALNSTYSPSVRSCRKIGGSYLFEAQFRLP
ncbi:MAG: TonB family protein, partial [Candidatus Baltobacteraceae bacterium]